MFNVFYMSYMLGFCPTSLILPLQTQQSKLRMHQVGTKTAQTKHRGVHSSGEQTAVQQMNCDAETLGKGY